MSKIQTNQIQHTQNGAQVFTIPTSDGSNGQFMKTDGSGALSFGTVSTASSTQGIQVAKQFRLSTGYGLPTNSRVSITNHWEAVDTDGFGEVTIGGTFADPSSGVFTFPSTGIWLVHFTAYYLAGTGTSSEAFITTTTDNNTYGVAANSRFEAHDGGDYHSPHVFFIFDVTDVSTHKVKFDVYSRWASTQVRGDTGQNQTYCTFIRLGDT